MNQNSDTRALASLPRAWVSVDLPVVRAASAGDRRAGSNAGKGFGGSRDGGLLIHFLSDQQGSVNWLLYIGTDRAEPVVAVYPPYGFELEQDHHPDYDPAGLAVFEPPAGGAVICAESFSGFIYRYWIENEIYFRVSVDEVPLTDEQRRYAEHYTHQPPQG